MHLDGEIPCAEVAAEELHVLITRWPDLAPVSAVNARVAPDDMVGGRSTAFCSRALHLRDHGASSPVRGAEDEGLSWIVMTFAGLAALSGTGTPLPSSSVGDSTVAGVLSAPALAATTAM